MAEGRRLLTRSFSDKPWASTRMARRRNPSAKARLRGAETCGFCGGIRARTILANSRDGICENHLTSTRLRYCRCSRCVRSLSLRTLGSSLLMTRSPNSTRNPRSQGRPASPTRLTASVSRMTRPMASCTLCLTAGTCSSTSRRSSQ